jgi:hypothetical protein
VTFSYDLFSSTAQPETNMLSFTFLSCSLLAACVEPSYNVIQRYPNTETIKPSSCSPVLFDPSKNIIHTLKQPNDASWNRLLCVPSNSLVQTQLGGSECEATRHPLIVSCCGNTTRQTAQL